MVIPKVAGRQNQLGKTTTTALRDTLRAPSCTPLLGLGAHAICAMPRDLLAFLTFVVAHVWAQSPPPPRPSPPRPSPPPPAPGSVTASTLALMRAGRSEFSFGGKSLQLSCPEDESPVVDYISPTSFQQSAAWDTVHTSSVTAVLRGVPFTCADLGLDRPCVDEDYPASHRAARQTSTASGTGRMA